MKATMVIEGQWFDSEDNQVDNSEIWRGTLPDVLNTYVEQEGLNYLINGIIHWFLVMTTIIIQKIYGYTMGKYYLFT